MKASTALLRIRDIQLPSIPAPAAYRCSTAAKIEPALVALSWDLPAVSSVARRPRSHAYSVPV